MHKKLLFALFLFSFTFFSINPVAAQEGEPIYVVQPGDTLSAIAARFNVSLSDLMGANNISDPNQLSAGQQLVIPGLEGISGILDTEVINFGDSFRSLMRRTQVPEDLFLSLNHVVSPSEFYVGVSMIVPAQEEGTDKKTRFTPAKGESLLEIAVKRNTDPWTLKDINALSGTWDGLPADTLYAPGGDNDQITSGLPSAFISAEIRDLPLKQGGTGVIKVKAQTGVTLGGILVDHPLHFFSDNDGTQIALQGIHALLEPGVYPLRIDATLPDGSIQSYEQMVLIISGNYYSEVIPLNDPSTIDPAVTEPELQQIQAVVADAKDTRYWSSIFKAPAAYPDCFTSRFGTRRTYKVINSETEIPGFHSGLDFCGGEGLPITAPAAGQVVFTQLLTVRGNAAIIDHGWGVYSGIWHQSKINVQVGDTVEQGQIIGEVGGTGRVTGAHLHWELWVNGVQVDPLDWLSQAYP